MPCIFTICASNLQEAVQLAAFKITFTADHCSLHKIAATAPTAAVHAVQLLLPSKSVGMHIVKRCSEQRQQSSKCLPIDDAGPA